MRLILEVWRYIWVINNIIAYQGVTNIEVLRYSKYQSLKGCAISGSKRYTQYSIETLKMILNICIFTVFLSRWIDRGCFHSQTIKARINAAHWSTLLHVWINYSTNWNHPVWWLNSRTHTHTHAHTHTRTHAHAHTQTTTTTKTKTTKTY